MTSASSVKALFEALAAPEAIAATMAAVKA